MSSNQVVGVICVSIKEKCAAEISFVYVCMCVCICFSGKTKTLPIMMTNFLNKLEAHSRITEKNNLVLNNSWHCTKVSRSSIFPIRFSSIQMNWIKFNSIFLCPLVLTIRNYLECGYFIWIIKKNEKYFDCNRNNLHFHSSIPRFTYYCNIAKRNSENHSKLFGLKSNFTFSWTSVFEWVLL